MRKGIVGGACVAGLALALPLAAPAAPRAGQDATVTMKDFRFDSSKLKPAQFGKESPLAPGQTTFTFKNTGKNPHNFVIIRTVQGTKFSGPTVEPGKSATLSVNLKPGSYVAICAVFNGFHAASGMVKAFSVGKIDEKGKWVA
jgi:uncharacterized cupredoxin-like copper-binding protein